MVQLQGNAKAEMSASLIALTWSFIIPRNSDATTIPRSLLFVWVSLLGTTAKLYFSQNPLEEPPQHPFAPVNPKHPSAALLWERICLKIVPNSRHSLHYDTKDNYGRHAQHKLLVWPHPKFTSRRQAVGIKNASTRAVRRERDESLTWSWQDYRRSANGNLLFLRKASSSCSQRCLQTVYFLLSSPLPPCAGGQ